ncbi:hypothetical protein [Blastococcus sp. TF02A-35]|uniref:hypothetical protein n=1 Tax=Blastococcus sp. TF02A-35 TaxID=2559612 RepID=UPI0010734A5B|nr:hypothetical protein [Blastococcus sp. TF02A_35]TFV43978.1 hypothetical protein E4P43_19245 [Blastococcus sp. TF02A_35]
MTEPSAQRPVPGPPRPGPSPLRAPAPGPAPEQSDAVPAPDGGTGEDTRARLGGLDELPVAEHVAVFEAEHERLQRELGTIDPL